MKECSKCLQSFAFEYFPRDCSKLGGRRNECRKCRRAFKKQWRDKNPKSVKMSAVNFRLKRAKLKEPEKETLKKEINERREKALKEKTAKRALKLTHKYCRTCRQWLDKDKGFHSDKNNTDGLSRKCRLCRAIYTIYRRGRTKGIEEDITSKDVWDIYTAYEFECYKCHNKEDLSLDHHYTNQKLSKRNAVVLCKACNTLKHTKSPEDFYMEDEMKLLTLQLGGGNK